MTMGVRIRLCRTDDVTEGVPVPVSLPDLPELAVYRIGDGYFVTDNLCTHGNAMLTDGFQDGEVIHCPFHGGAFDIRTGAPESFPCQTALRTYPVDVRDGWISIEWVRIDRAQAVEG